MLQNEYLVAKIGVDPAENEPSNDLKKICKNLRLPPHPVVSEVLTLVEELAVPEVLALPECRSEKKAC